MNDRSGWRYRGYLPHFDGHGVLQSVTFRLADSIPVDALRRLQQWQTLGLERRAATHAAAAQQRELERLADAGHGECLLRQPAIAAIVVEALRHGDGTRYVLDEWCVMPNHVHVLLEPITASLGTIVGGWKSFTAREINRLLARTGSVWMADYFDRYIRDAGHHEAVAKYIRENPVKTGLVSTSVEWPWGSAALRPQCDGQCGSPE